MISIDHAQIISTRHNQGEKLYLLLNEFNCTNHEYNDALSRLQNHYSSVKMSKSMRLVKKAEERIWELIDLINDPLTHEQSRARFNRKLTDLTQYYAKADINQSVLIPEELLR